MTESLALQGFLFFGTVLLDICKPDKIEVQNT